MLWLIVSDILDQRGKLHDIHYHTQTTREAQLGKVVIAISRRCLLIVIYNRWKDVIWLEAHEKVDVCGQFGATRSSLVREFLVSLIDYS